MKKLTDQEMKRYREYTKKPKMMRNCKVDALVWSTAESKKHFLAKAGKLYDLVADGHRCITEAIPHSNYSLRHDLVDLTDGVIYEFETSPKRALRFVDMKGVEVVMVR